MISSLPRSFPPLPKLASVAALLLLAAVLAWWVHVIRAAPPVVPTRPAPPASIDASAGATLFGATPDSGRNDTVQLLGVLSFDAQHAAAIVSVGGQPARIVKVKDAIADNATLAEVREHSIVIDRHGIQREIELHRDSEPSVFVR